MDRNKYQIHIPLPPKIDPTVTMMQVSIAFTYLGTALSCNCDSFSWILLWAGEICSLERFAALGWQLLTHLFVVQVEEKPDVTYSDVGGCKEQIEKLREVVETPLLHVSNLQIEASIILEVFWSSVSI